MTDLRRQHKTALDAQIEACTRCPGMNIRRVTQAAPGYGSLRSPIVIVGESLCRRCMELEPPVPFTGGSGRVLDRSLALAGIAKHKVFITNAVHCHPPDDHKPTHREMKAGARTVGPICCVSLRSSRQDW